jgi:hypothetical protein
LKTKLQMASFVIFLTLTAVGCTPPVDVSTPTASSSPPAVTPAHNPSYEILAGGGYAYPDIPRTTSEDLRAQIDWDSSPLIIDLRDASSYTKGHLAGAISIPYAISVSGAAAMDRQLTELPDDKLKIFYCD